MRNKTRETNSWITRPINSTRKKKKQTVRHDLLRFVLKLHQLQVRVYWLIYGIIIFFKFLFTKTLVLQTAQPYKFLGVQRQETAFQSTVTTLFFLLLPLIINKVNNVVILSS